jgi:hypothetical protein
VDELRNTAVRLALVGERLVEELNRRADEHRARDLAQEAAELATYIAERLEPSTPLGCASATGQRPRAQSA